LADYTDCMNPDDVRRWVENHRAAAARERAEMRQHPLTPQEAFSAAMALLVLDESRNGPPFGRHDAVSLREDAEMYETWAKLRARWPRNS
jgi:hypothetical protein